MNRLLQCIVVDNGWAVHGRLLNNGMETACGRGISSEFKSEYEVSYSLKFSWDRDKVTCVSCLRVFEIMKNNFNKRSTVNK